MSRYRILQWAIWFAIAIVASSAVAVEPEPANNQKRTGQDWPHWRGPNRNDHIAEISRWTSDSWLPSKPVWTKRLGEGSSSPIVVQNKVYTLGWKGERETVSCFDAVTGNELWAVPYPAPRYGRNAVGDQSLHFGVSVRNGSITGLGFNGVQLGFQAEVSDVRVRWTRSPASFSKVARVISMVRCFGPEASAVMYGRLISVAVRVLSSHFAFSAASRRR